MADLESQIVGQSEKTVALKKMVQLVGPADSPIIITGPTGTGKEVVANAIHSCSRRGGKFIAINCAAIPKDLIEAELFGFEKGAFTGALKTTKGKFEQANNGTLFLDEIGDMPLDLQSKLLRVLENSIIARVGGSQDIRLNVRIICATHKNLEEAVSNQNFREDLLYRLNVLPVNIPSLKERIDDVPCLIDHFLKQKTRNRQIQKPIFTTEAFKALKKYHWPGNVREVRNVVERSLVFFPGKTVGKTDVENFLIAFDPAVINRTEEQNELWSGFENLTTGMDSTELTVGDEVILTPEAFSDWFEKNNFIDLRKMLRDIEIVLIEAAMKKNNYNTSEAAKDLKLLRTTLIEKIKKYGLSN